MPVAARRRRPFRWSRLLLHGAIVVLIVIWLLPTIGLFVNSIRTPIDVARTGWWNAFLPPWNFTLDNYAQVLAKNGHRAGVREQPADHDPGHDHPDRRRVASRRTRSRGWSSADGTGCSSSWWPCWSIPLQTTFVPLLTILGPKGIHLLGAGPGAFVAVWLAHTGYGLPFAIFLLTGYMRGLPKEVFESAEIDGAGHASMFFRLAIPMSIPVIAALAIFQFLFVWNDLLVALMFIGAQNAANLPLTIAIANLSTSLGGDWQLLMAAAFISMALPLIVFFALQRYFVRGITGGAVKG